MAQWNNGDAIRVSARLQSATGEDIVNVFHYYVDIPGGTADTFCITPLLAQIDDMYDHIEPSIPSDVTFVDIDIMNVTQGLVYPAYPWPVQTVGGGTGDTMPEQCAALVVGRTAFSHVVGRKFLGPFIETTNNDGAWSSTLKTMLDAFLVDYLYDVVIGIVGYLLPGVVKYVGGVATGFSAFMEGYTTTGIYTQRRRRRGVGS